MRPHVPRPLAKRPALRATVDGRDLAVYREGTGPPALLFPLPWGLSAPFLLDAIGPARKYLTVHTFDPPGIGASGPAEDAADATTAGLARLAAGLLDALDLADVRVIGHSAGALAAMTLLASDARNVADRVARATLVSPFAVGKLPRTTPADPSLAKLVDEFRVAWKRAESGRAEDASSLLALCPAVYASEDGGATLVLEELMKREDAARFAARFPAVSREVGSLDLRPLLPKIGVPTWIVLGAEDAIVPPASTEEVAGLVPGARLSRYAGASHFAYFEKPAVFHRHHRAWAVQGEAPSSSVLVG